MDCPEIDKYTGVTYVDDSKMRIHETRVFSEDEVADITCRVTGENLDTLLIDEIVKRREDGAVITASWISAENENIEYRFSLKAEVEGDFFSNATTIFKDTRLPLSLSQIEAYYDKITGKKGGYQDVASDEFDFKYEDSDLDSEKVSDVENLREISSEPIAFFDGGRWLKRVNSKDRRDSDVFRSDLNSWYRPIDKNKVS